MTPHRRRRATHSTKDHDNVRDPLWVVADSLVPVTQAGADVMKRIAIPMIGGIITSTIMELLIYPVISMLWKKRELTTATKKAPSVAKDKKE
jgi:hypothetical protein